MTGTGELSGSFTIPATASGTFVEPILSLTLSSSGFQLTSYTGTLSHGILTGNLNGSAFDNLSMTLTRR